VTDPTALCCLIHRWERRLESPGGAERVVRVCLRCGRKELVWSRRGSPPRLASAEKGGRAGRCVADK